MKILLVLQTPWGPDLGMSKVHYDLKTEYEKQGHHVDYLDYNKLYPKGQNVYSKSFGIFYTERILEYLQKYANQYDVIDANFSCIIYPKSAYFFKGLVVYRSHGLQPLYRQIEQSAAYQKMQDFTAKKLPLKTKIGNLYRYMQKKDGDYELFNSLKNADVVHALNQAEYDYFAAYGIPADKIVLVPNGIADDFIKVASDKQRSLGATEISFIGSWTVRKGIKDLNDIVVNVKKAADLKKLNILGGGADRNSVLAEFDSNLHDNISVIPHFNQNDLPKLLENCRVGVFPSYAEGFGLAIVEQLALGIPVVAYNTPGPADILAPIDSSLLVPPGDKIAMAKKVLELLDLPTESYQSLSQMCRNRAFDFKMSVIAQRFIDVYQLFLGNLQ